MDADGIDRRHKSTDISGCRSDCDEKKVCLAFEYSHTENFCKLHTSSHPESYEYSDYVFCAKGQDGCPIGYTYRKNHSTLESQILGSKPSTTLADCRQDCDMADNCNSFEYNSNVPLCKLLTQSEPNVENVEYYSDSMFCSKGILKIVYNVNYI